LEVLLHLVIIGSGVIGLTSAYYLSSLGYKVTVIEKNNSSAMEASIANGSLLSYTSGPLASPSVLKMLPQVLLGLHPSIRVRDWYNPRFLTWSLAFLMECLPNTFSANRLTLINQLSESDSLMKKFISQHPFNFEYKKTGKLYLYSSKQDFDGALSFSKVLKKDYGIEQVPLTRDDCIRKEPSIASVNNLYGALFSPVDAIGNCKLFCDNLQTVLEKPPYNVKFLFKTKPVEFILNARKIERLVLNNGKKISCDAAVVTAGAVSNDVTRLLGFRIPVYPLKGLSLDITATNPEVLPKISVIDNRARITLAPFGTNNLRVAGIAEFSGTSTDIKDSHLDCLKKQVLNILPDLDIQHIDAFCGNRPMTPSSLPLIERRHFQNLYLNCGHGTLGWSLAHSSGKKIADLVSSELGNSRK
jgi:D-amino-acid dehydrogenase